MVLTGVRFSCRAQEAILPNNPKNLIIMNEKIFNTAVSLLCEHNPNEPQAKIEKTVRRGMAISISPSEYLNNLWKNLGKN